MSSSDAHGNARWEFAHKVKRERSSGPVCGHCGSQMRSLYTMRYDCDVVVAVLHAARRNEPRHSKSNMSRKIPVATRRRENGSVGWHDAVATQCIETAEKANCIATDVECNNCITVPNLHSSLDYTCDDNRFSRWGHTGEKRRLWQRLTANMTSEFPLPQATANFCSLQFFQQFLFYTQKLLHL